MSVDFSERYQHSSALIFPSPDGQQLAVAVAHRLVIRRADTLQIEQLFTCNDTINAVEWSADGALVLCLVSKRDLCHVYCVADPDWKCRVTEGVAGLVHAKWAPDSRHLVTFADFNLHLTVWPLDEGRGGGGGGPRHVKNPKWGAGLSMRASGRVVCSE